MVRGNYSHTVGIKERYRQYREANSWLVGYDWLLLLFAAVFSGLIVTTMYQTTDPEIVDIAVFQLVMGFVGLMIGGMITMTKDRLSIRMPNLDDAEKMFVCVTGGFIGLEIFNRATSYVFNPYSGYDINIQVNMLLTAAVMEEAIFSFAFTTFFFIIFAYIISSLLKRYNEEIEWIVIISAAIFVGILFVLIHNAVYGFNPTIMLQLFVNRVVYAILYIKTKNLTVPTLLHLVHNIMVFI